MTAARNLPHADMVMSLQFAVNLRVSWLRSSIDAIIDGVINGSTADYRTLILTRSRTWQYFAKTQLGRIVLPK
jgi:hypothetical protein